MRVFAITGPISSSIKEFSQQFADKISLKVKVTILDESDFLMKEDEDVALAKNKLIPAEYDKNKPIDYEHLKTAISCQSGVVIVRGNYLFADESLRALFNVKVFVSADGDTCLANYLQDIKPTATTLEPVLEFYEKDIKIKNDEQISKLQKYADITIPEAKIKGPGVTLLLSSVEGLFPQESKYNFFTDPPAPPVLTGPEGSIGGVDAQPQEPDEGSASLPHQGAF